VLFGGQGDTDRLHAVVLCGVQDQRPPAAADVEQPLPLLQAELAADYVQLRGLRVVQRLAVAAEKGRRVGHVLVQQQFVELVRQVVVVRDRRPVAPAGVQTTGQPGLRCGSRRRRTDGAEPGGQRGGLDSLTRGHARRRRPRPADSPRPPQPVAEVALDVDAPGHIRAGKPHFAWHPEQSA
jgi:hypothetical protein